MMAWPCQSRGVLIATDEERKLHVRVDPAIVAYARALVPPSIQLNNTRYEPHITVVRNETVDPQRWQAASRFHGVEVPFHYDPRVVAGEVYWWLRAWSDELVAVRRSLGLPDLSDWCRPPDLDECFHITIGNTKGTDITNAA